MFKRRSYIRKPLQTQATHQKKTSLKEKIFRRTCLGVFLILAYFLGWMKVWAGKISNGIAYLASVTIGQKMNTDETNNINILLVGYGGGSHDGAQLADSIMLASYNPKSHSVAMLSLPRDLLVENEDNTKVKINSILSRAYNSNGGNIELAAKKLIASVEKVTGLTIPYYAMIDFDGFIQVVDSLGGLDVYVPKHFLDMEYPVDWDGSTEIFELSEGRNHLSGPNTLKYARSRHSTSDFSRSKRQQDILQALAKKLMSGSMFSPQKFQELYKTYATIVKTNITIEELIGLAQHGSNLPAIYSFGYTTQCMNNAWRTMSVGCLLKDTRGNIVPAQASGENLYYLTQFFASLLTSDPELLTRDIPVHILNASDKEQAKLLPYGDGIASKTASKLKRYGIHVVSVANAGILSTGSYAELYGTGDYQKTLELIQNFVPLTATHSVATNISPDGELMSGGIYLYLGDDYLHLVGSQEFDFYGTVQQ